MDENVCFMEENVCFMDEYVCFMDENVYFMDEKYWFMDENCSIGQARSRSGRRGGAGAGPEHWNLSRGVRRSESAGNVGRSDVP